MLKNCSPRSTFRSSDVAKLHAAVARSTFGSENVKKTLVLGAPFEVRMSHQSFNQSINQSSKQAIKQASNQSINQSVSQLAS